MSLQDRIKSLIPGGAHTYSRGSDQYPANAPDLLISGKGCTVVGSDGKKYIDYGMGLRSVGIGYANDRVDEAVISALRNGNNLAKSSLLELEAAEAIVRLIPDMAMVKFAKNGSNVTTAAVKLARAYTGRTLVAIPSTHPFFSFDDWFIGSTVMSRGVLNTYKETTVKFEYGDRGSLLNLFHRYPNQICAVLMEPLNTILPCGDRQEADCDSSCATKCNLNDNFLRFAQELASEHKSLFILDEIVTGFRWRTEGAGSYFNVSPDLCTFGKAMANGFSCSALVGKREIMEIGGIDDPSEERVFLLSSTYGGESTGLAAFIATLDFYQKHDVCNILWRRSGYLKYEFNRLAKQHGIDDIIRISGNGPLIYLDTENRHTKNDYLLRTRWAEVLAENGILMPWISVSYSHTEEIISKSLEIFDNSMTILKDRIKNSDPLIKSHTMKPVFRRYN